MSPSIMEQKGPASTRVRSRTRTPVRGAAEGERRPARPSLFGTRFSFPGPLGPAPRDGVDAITGPSGPAPEEPSAVESAELREVKHVVDRLHGHPRSDPDSLRLRSVAHEARPAVELDDRD